jgi:hypothetical protein
LSWNKGGGVPPLSFADAARAARARRTVRRLRQRNTIPTSSWDNCCIAACGPDPQRGASMADFDTLIDRANKTSRRATTTG